jgi:hypothetical protein
MWLPKAPGGGTERFWIAIYDTVAGDSDGISPLAVYGPAPEVPFPIGRRNREIVSPS